MCSSWTEGGWLGDAAGYERMKALNIEDLRCAARRRVPRVVFDYIDGGAEGEFTMQENLRAFEQLHFRPRQAVAFTECDLRTRVLGCELSIPVLLAPVGYCRVMHPGGEIAASRAAGKAGAGYILSTVSGHPLEKVKAASGGPAWYQLYLTGGRAAAEQAISRAHNCGYKVLVITIDTIIIGKRERELRSGMEQLLRGSLWSKLPFLPDVLTRPRWLLRYLADGGLPTMPNIVRPGKGPLRISEAHTAMVRSAFTWDDMTWIRQQWRGPIAIKGVLSTDDALRSLDCGASAVIVSNHGGRQLDGVQASLRVLPEIVDAVQGRAEVLFDSGIRRGSDIVKAMCLGAKAVLIGRAFAYGLAAAGEAGVAHALQILRADIDRTLRLLGCHSVRALDKTYLDIPAMWSRNHKPELQSN
jgi:isopentenyl diphosphate isomerase/L-lactate dehydrogenase-like FMN-dependent dehydrogenase